MYCSWTQIHLLIFLLSVVASCIWNFTGCNSKKGFTSSTKMFHTVTLFTFIIPFVFFPFCLWWVEGGMRDSQETILGCRQQRSVEVNRGKRSVSEPVKLFPAEISRADDQLTEVPKCIRKWIVPGFRCPKVVSELGVQVLFAVAGEKQIYKECNSFHADMEALDQHVHACLSIDGRGSPYI